MADEPAPSSGGGKSSFGFLTRKVGPLPVWGWAAIAAGGYYWYTRYGPGKTAQVTDPAGNTCAAVNPVTGYCPGTPEDQAAAGTAGSAGGDGGGPVSSGGGGGPGGPPVRKPPPKPAPKPKPKPPDRDPNRPRPEPHKHKPVRTRTPYPTPRPERATAPMTAGHVYGPEPTATMNGSTYPSGQPDQVSQTGVTAMEEAGQYVAPG